MLTSAPVLTIPNSHDPYLVYTEASSIGLGCVVMQNGRVAAYTSQQLKPHRRIIPLMISRTEFFKGERM